MPTIDAIPKRAQIKPRRPWLLLEDHIVNHSSTKEIEKPLEISPLKKTKAIPTIKIIKNKDNIHTKKIHIEDKIETNHGQKNKSVDNMETNQGQIEAKLDTKLETILETNRVQDFKKKSGAPVSFIMLSGLQKIITLYIYEACKLSRSKVTNPVSMEHLTKNCACEIWAAKKALQRLEEKKIISRVLFKKGRGGWTQYEISETIYQTILQNENLEIELLREKNLSQTDAKLETELGTISRTNVPYSSSNNIYIKTTTNEIDSVDTSINEFENEEFSNIDIAPLWDVGLKNTHLLQIIKNSSLDAETIQDSIYAFSFDLRKNNLEAKLQTKKINPLRYFMGTLLKGIPYNPPDNYESPQQEARRQWLEAKKREQEKERVLQEELIKIAYEEWKGITDINPIIQEVMKDFTPEVRKNEHVIEGRLSNYYKQNIWPNEKTEFFKKMEIRI